MPRITSLEVLLDPAGKMLLAEAYNGVIENVQKATISGQLKNTDLVERCTISGGSFKKKGGSQHHSLL